MTARPPLALMLLSLWACAEEEGGPARLLRLQTLC